MLFHGNIFGLVLSLVFSREEVILSAAFRVKIIIIELDFRPWW